MNFEELTVLVTGANRGLGRHFVESLLLRGVRRVYAGTRTKCSFENPRVTPVSLDVTCHQDVAQAVVQCADVNLVINNAGIMLSSPAMASDAQESLRREMEVNVFGLHAMIHAFAPVLARNGGGGIINMLSVVSWFTSPFNATYGASKHAALSISDAARIELADQKTQVTGVYAGFIDTEMTAHLTAAKSSPQDVVNKALDGYAAGVEHVLGDERAKQVLYDLQHSPDMFLHKLKNAWAQRS